LKIILENLFRHFLNLKSLIVVLGFSIWGGLNFNYFFFVKKKKKKNPVISYSVDGLSSGSFLSTNVSCLLRN